MGLVIFKLGGSLLSCAGLAGRLRAVLEQRPHDRRLIVVGGGATTDVVREWTRFNTLSEEVAHWLAVRSLSLNRALVEHLLPESREVSSCEAAELLWSEGNRPLLLDVETWLRAAEIGNRPPLPHCWDVTSDSIAAWVAAGWDADELVLLKSTSLPAGVTLDEAAQRNLVDPYFQRLSNDMPRISWCNLRGEVASIVTWLNVSQLRH